ncbi:MAG: hypothetical protein NTU95_10770 [Methanothrix sp.]|nr:hypothetical protein [Methanothrix sp.]
MAGMSAGLELQERQGCSLAVQSARVRSSRRAGTPARQGTGGPFGGIVAVVRFTCLLLWGSRKDAIDIYDHIDLKKLKEAYRACLPQLRI